MKNKFKTLLLSSALAFSLISPSFATNVDVDGIDLSALEEKYPAHFAGFSCMPLELAPVIREGSNKPFQHLPQLETAFTLLLKKLDGNQEHAALSEELREFMSTHPQAAEEYTLFRYVYFIFKLAAAQKRGSMEEEYFLTGAGFPFPYNLINKRDLSGALSSFNKFVTLLADGADDDDSDDEFTITVNQNFRDPKDVIDKCVEQGPYARVVLPLPGEDNLGFFYLAWTFFQGIHPVSLPLGNNPSELHGILMSRYAKFCHDLAHDQNDKINQIVEQFIAHLVNHNLKMSRAAAGFMSQEQRKLFSVKHVLPHFAGFGMDVHNLYHTSLLNILRFSLKDMNPNLEDKRPDFEAFSVGSLLVGHEEQEYIPDAYGTPVLKDILKSEVDLEDEKPEADEDKPEADEDKKRSNANLFKTSFLTGETNLTDQEIFDLVKERPLKEFQGNHFFGEPNINLNEVVDYQVLRTKFYTQVTISMLDGEERKFRQKTNYTIRLNLKHDWTILKAAETVLKRDYNYVLPVIPELDGFQDEAAYEQAAKDCRKALDLGFKHLKDNWLKQAIRLSELKPADSPSIAESFTAEYTAALERARQNCFPGIEPESTAFWQEQIDKATRGRTEEVPFDVNNDNNANDVNNNNNDNNAGDVDNNNNDSAEE